MYYGYILLILLIILIFNVNNEHYDQDITKISKASPSLLVLYTFHKYDRNVQYFIDNGVYYDSNVDFIFIINNKDLKVTCPDYVKVINRENTGYDFGAWSEGLLTNNLYKKYDKFIFLNSSVVGPIMAPYYNGKWTDIFMNGLSDTIKLYGCTINTCGMYACDKPDQDSHIQSYAFSTDKIGIEILINAEVFSLTNQINNYVDVVQQKEIRMSREIINNKYNIGCIFNYYRDIDFRNIKPYKLLNDLTHNRHYFNENLHPYEVVFIKEKNIQNKEWINQYIN